MNDYFRKVPLGVGLIATFQSYLGRYLLRTKQSYRKWLARWKKYRRPRPEQHSETLSS